ncbi:MAG: hypothetical protein HY599_06175 [Candidatus Omnitrophica bacterium]|nr:hypothetical protein [Candidatus Omnitrophota bacterium]
MIKVPKLPQLRPRERLLAAGGVIIVLAVLFDRLVFNSYLRHAQTVHRETQRLERTLKHYDRLLQRKAQVDAQLGAYQRYLRAPIADELQMAMLLKEVEGLAGETGVTLGEVKPLPPEADELSRRYSLDIQFECTLERWVDFVTRVETSPSLYQILRATLAADEDLPDRLAASLRVTSKSVRVPDTTGPVARGTNDAKTAVR